MMSETPRPPKKHYSSRNDLLIILVAALLLFFLIEKVDHFARITDSMHELVHGEFSGLLPTLIGLNFVLAALLVLRWRAFRREVSHSSETARRLEAEHHLLRSVIDQLPDYIFAKDLKGRFTLSNVAHARAVNATPEALIGKTALDFFPPELAKQFQADDAAVSVGAKPLVNMERISIDQSGQERFMMTTKVPLKDVDGQVTGLIGISRDITHRKQQEEQALELARERERVKMMSGFTRDAAHDFRTPLATINASLYLLLKATDAETRQRHANVITQAVTRLTRLLDGLTTMTQLDSIGKLEMEVVDLNQLIRSVVAAVPSLTHHPRLRHRLELADGMPLVCGAPYELSQVFLNLIENAAQFTPDDGSLVIRTFYLDDRAVVEVRDTGIGISTDELPHIFDRFYRTDRARSDDTGGIGLGLSIARKIVELHGGSIEVESQPDHGSTFRVWLPVTTVSMVGAPCVISPAV